MLRGIRRFKMSYQSFPLEMLPGKRRPDVEEGGKMIMPPSALAQLSGLDITYPMLFRLTNEAIDRASHCGVLEFVAEEDKVYIPQWMMRNLNLAEGSDVLIENVELPIGRYSKFLPITPEFYDITNPKAVLESCLRLFACLTTTDIITISYNNKIYELYIVETRPGQAINIIECDMDVEFAPPLEYEDPIPPQGTEESIDPTDFMPTTSTFVPFQGIGHRLDGKKRKSSTELEEPPPKVKYVKGVPDYSYRIGTLNFMRRDLNNFRRRTKDEDEGKFQPFSGTGNVLKDD